MCGSHAKAKLYLFSIENTIMASTWLQSRMAEALKLTAYSAACMCCNLLACNGRVVCVSALYSIVVWLLGSEHNSQPQWRMPIEFATCILTMLRQQGNAIPTSPLITSGSGQKDSLRLLSRYFFASLSLNSIALCRVLTLNICARFIRLWPEIVHDTCCCGRSRHTTIKWK